MFANTTEYINKNRIIFCVINILLIKIVENTYDKFYSW